MIYARLSYNTQNWQRPSGPIGKSRNQGIHEFDFGFGFEEWLHSNQFILPDKEGAKYHYGYVEGIHKNYSLGDEQDVLTLFTINCTTRQRFWVGEIKQWQAVDQAESLYIANQNPQLIHTMRNNVAAVTNNLPIAVNRFNQHVANQNGFQLFNIKWKAMKFQFDIKRPINRNNPLYNFYRFWLHRR
jgi:hypothetical protein